MKTLIFFMSFFCVSAVCQAQKQLLSYDDLKYLVENSLGKADTFLTAKGYALIASNTKNHTRKFTAGFNGGTKKMWKCGRMANVFI